MWPPILHISFYKANYVFLFFGKQYPKPSSCTNSNFLFNGVITEVEQTNIETNESTSYDDKDDNAEGSLASSKVDTAVAHTVKDFFGKSLESDNFKQVHNCSAFNLLLLVCLLAP